MAHEHRETAGSEAGARGRDPGEPLRRPGDRRAHPRTETALRCKVLAEGRVRYLPGRTLDVSAGGASVELRTTRALRAGEAVEIAVNWDEAALLRREGARAGRVVRAGPLVGGRQVAALAYESAEGLPEIVVRGAAPRERRSAA